MTALPQPPYGLEVDVRDLDGFMLNVERLMASELVALSSHEVIAAALFLWCRAWKQLPAASLPDDDRVMAAFSRLPYARFKKLKPEVLRGFTKHADERWYHRTLSAEALVAFARKKSFQGRREKDADRLRQWRSKQDRNAGETHPETNIETRFVREGQGRDGTGTGPKEEERGAKDAADPPSASSGEPKAPKRRRAAKAETPWPDGFSLTDDMATYAKQAGFDPAWLFEKFETKARAKGWTYCDWAAAFRNFATTEKGYTRLNGASQPGARRAPDC